MSRRLDVKETSDVLVNFRMTTVERDELRALSRYLGMSASELFRKWIREERRRLLDEGRKPPRK